MNRRDVLFGLATGLASCASREVRRAAGLRRGPASTPRRPAADVELPPPIQGGQCPLVFHGDVLYHATGRQLQTLDGETLAVTDALPLEATNVAVLDDRTLAVATNPGGGHFQLHRLDRPTGRSEVFQVFTGEAPRIGLFATSALELVVAGGRTLAFKRFAGASLTDRASFELPPRPRIAIRHDGEQVAALGDGLALYPGTNRLHLLGDRSREYPTGALPVHLAPAGADRVWFSTNAGEVVLASIGERLARVAAHALAPMTVIHLSAVGDVAAVVLGTYVPTERAEVVVLDRQGIRWRRPLPTGGARPLLPYVALSPTRVVAWRGRDSPLLAWDAATGAPMVSGATDAGPSR